MKSWIIQTSSTNGFACEFLKVSGRLLPCDFADDVRKALVFSREEAEKLVQGTAWKTREMSASEFFLWRCSRIGKSRSPRKLRALAKLNARKRRANR